jgi:hypothetical protein
MWPVDFTHKIVLEVVDRIYPYQGEKRQHFPSVKQILELRTLRKTIKGPDFAESLRKLLSGSSPHSAANILELVVKFRHYEATDPRDKIYGVLGIVQKEDDIFKSIVVDYRTPVIDLYTKFATSVILHQGNLSLLEHCRGQSLKSLPSWVPDWSYSREGIRLGENASLLAANPSDTDTSKANRSSEQQITSDTCLPEIESGTTLPPLESSAPNLSLDLEERQVTSIQ